MYYRNLKLSVLMSVYKNDNSLQLQECLESLYNQTIPADEIVLVEDGYVQGELKSIIEEYCKKLPIKNCGYEQNHGLAYALNFGLDYCTGDLIARMDSDDICFPDRFEKQISEFENNPELQILGTGIQEFYIQDNGNNIETIRLYPAYTNKKSKTLYKGTPLAHPTLMIRANILKEYRYNSSNKKYSQDLELWFRLLDNGFYIKTIQEPLLHFRITDKTFERRNKTKAKYEFKLYFKYLYKFNGFSINLIYPVLRYFSRMMPKKVIKRLYFSKKRIKMLGKGNDSK